jgi:hypothetical protein
MEEGEFAGYGDWEDRPVRVDVREAKAWRVFPDREVLIAEGSMAADIWLNSAPISKEEALKMASEEVAVQAES